MFEQEIERIYKTAKQRVLQRFSDSVVVKDIFAADIPHQLKVFFRTDVELILDEEIQKYRKSSRFNFNFPEIQSLQNQINSILIMHFSYPLDEYLRRLEDTVHLLVNYLIRPQWTLKNVIFENENTVSCTEISRILRYFGSYEYLKDLINRYLQDKAISTITKEEFSSTIWKLDGEYMRRKSGDEIARILLPVYDFLDYPLNSGTKTIPTKGLIKYFEDKGLTSVVVQLEGELAQGTTGFNQKELASFLEEVRRTSGTFQIEKPAEEGEKVSASGHQSTLQQTPLTKLSLLDLINDSDKRRYIKKIFEHDESAFINSIKILDEMTSWKQASVYIDEIFIQYDIDPYSSEAKKFKDVVFQSYFPKS